MEGLGAALVMPLGEQAPSLCIVESSEDVYGILPLSPLRRCVSRTGDIVQVFRACWECPFGMWPRSATRTLALLRVLSSWSCCEASLAEMVYSTRSIGQD